MFRVISSKFFNRKVSNNLQSNVISIQKKKTLAFLPSHLVRTNKLNQFITLKLKLRSQI